MDNRKWLYLPLVGATLIYFCACLQKVIVPGATFNEVQALFQIDAAETIRLGTAFYFVYAVLQLAAGPLADRFGGAKVIAVFGAFFVFGSFLSATASSSALLLVSRIVTGAGAGMMAQAVLKLSDRIAGDKLSVVFSVVTMLGYAGSILGTSPFIAGVQCFGYRAMMLAAALLAVIAYVIHLTSCAADRAPAAKTEAAFSLRGWFRCFNGRNVLFFFAMGIPFATTFSFLTIFGKKFLEDYVLMTSVAAGGILFGMTIIAAVNGFVVAVISRKFFGNDPLPVMRYSSFGSFFAMVALAALVALDIRSAAAVGFLAFVLSSTANILPVYIVYLRRNNPSDRFVTVNSIMNFSAYVFTSFAAFLAGKLLGFFTPENVGGVLRYGKNAYLAILLGLILFSAVAVVCNLGLRGKNGENKI